MEQLVIGGSSKGDYDMQRGLIQILCGNVISITWHMIVNIQENPGSIYTPGLFKLKIKRAI